jgi:hypothetical protein
MTLNGDAYVSLSGAILSGCWAVAFRAYDSGTAIFQNGQVYCAGTTHITQSLRGGYINAEGSVIEGCKTVASTAFYVASGGGIDAAGATTDAATFNATAVGTGGNGAYVTY